MVYFESHDGAIWSFQMPCRFAGWVPGREEEISRYRPYWNSSAENCGSFDARVLGDPHVGRLVGRRRCGPGRCVTRPNSAW